MFGVEDECECECCGLGVCPNLPASLNPLCSTCLLECREGKDCFHCQACRSHTLTSELSPEEFRVYMAKHCTPENFARWEVENKRMATCQNSDCGLVFDSTEQLYAHVREKHGANN